jgi:hypothetical protein
MKSEVRALKKRLSELEKEIKALQQFRPTKALDEFKRRLVGEQSYIKRQIQIQKTRKETARERRRRLSQANRDRSEKMKRSWRYFKALQENYYPDKSMKEIRSSFKKHREGLETDISEVAWRNPSP